MYGLRIGCALVTSTFLNLAAAGEVWSGWSNIEDIGVLTKPSHAISIRMPTIPNPAGCVSSEMAVLEGTGETLESSLSLLLAAQLGHRSANLDIAITECSLAGYPVVKGLRVK